MIAFLLGFRGAGKTTLGRRLAADEGWDFLDLDEEWESEAGLSILSFVEKNGVDAFRREEEDFLRRTVAAARLHPSLTILATGGGVVDSVGSREFLLQSPEPKIFVETSPEELWRRLENSPERRKIGALTDLEALRALWSNRLPQYEKIATHRVKNQDITLALAELKSLLRSIGAAG